MLITKLLLNQFILFKLEARPENDGGLLIFDFIYIKVKFFIINNII